MNTKAKTKRATTIQLRVWLSARIVFMAGRELVIIAHKLLKIGRTANFGTLEDGHQVVYMASYGSAYIEKVFRSCICKAQLPLFVGSDCPQGNSSLKREHLLSEPGAFSCRLQI